MGTPLQPFHPRPPGVGALLGASVVALVTLVLLAGCAVGGPETPVERPAASRTPSPAASPTGSPTAARGSVPPVPPRAAAPAAPRTGPEDNSLYRIDLAAGAGRCELEVRRPRPALPDRRLAGYLREVVDCLVRVFRPPLAEAGFTLTRPRVKTFRGREDTPCGRLGPDGPPAFYCPLAATIYWSVTSDDGDEAYTFARLGYVGLAAHEFGHHLQTVTGIVGEYGRRYDSAATRKERYLLSRRLQLQAQCFEGVFLRHVEDTLELEPRDRTELRSWHSYTGDEDPPANRRPDHGTSAAQVFWLERGLDGADFGRCDTWTAPPRRVR